MFSEERMLTNLRFEIINSTSNLLKYGTLKCHVLDNVHFSTDLFLPSFVADEASAGTWKEPLRILSK